MKDGGKKQSYKQRLQRLTKIIIVEGLILIALLIVLGCRQILNFYGEKEEKNTAALISPASKDLVTESATKEPIRVGRDEKKFEECKAKAMLMAAQYDYDGAMNCITSYEKETSDHDLELADMIKQYQTEKKKCVPFGAYKSASEINHVFVHSLIVDTDKAFHSYEANGYNYYMTTISEFREMIQELYDQGYVMIDIHDIIDKKKSNGEVVFRESKELLLPPDKKPFVLSEDDVNYYEYMKGDGFASRMVLDEEGNPSTEMDLPDGTSKIGEYDVVPIIENFVKEHPDFSYHGAKGIIALTGYEGTLGYRTNPENKGSDQYQKDCATVKKVAKVMRDHGWQFACHSNGHQDMNGCTQAFLKKDTTWWRENVGSLVGDTDIYIYPFGLDVQPGIAKYHNEKYQYLKKNGFSIFCGVEAKPWMQIGDHYMRMQRRPLDGQAMLMYPERLKDLFDLSKVIDKNRPPLDSN